MDNQLIIQVLLLVGVAVVAVLLTRSTASARHQAIRRLLLVGFVIGAALSVIFPTWLTWLARLLGVGRGADLLLYALVIAFLSYIATTFRRLNVLERKITKLTREVALERAKLGRTEREHREAGALGVVAADDGPLGSEAVGALGSEAGAVGVGALGSEAGAVGVGAADDGARPSDDGR